MYGVQIASKLNIICLPNLYITYIISLYIYYCSILYLW